jgi:AcrR family transcriptional regulator
MSLREEKKRLVRQALLESADRHFLREGYDATTLEEICSDVRVSIRTLLRYFTSKERLALDGHYQAFEKFERSIAEREAGISVMEFWRAFVSRYAGLAKRDHNELRRRRLIESVPILYSARLSILRRYEDLLTVNFAAERGTDTSDLRARLTAVALVWGNEACGRRWAESAGEVDLQQLCLGVIEVVSEDLVGFSPVTNPRSDST